ncbi:MAG TPA: tetratricopeptide repeat protein [Cytophagaceae bacterium]|nr:tetratricopeptide repeat protein [Cytophagaceae bacterium]
MRIINLVVIAVLLFAANSFAQVINLGEDFDKALAKYDEGDYAGTVADLEKLIPEVEKVYQDTSAFYTMQNMMGASLLQLKRSTEGETYLNKTINFYAAPPANFNDDNNYFALNEMAALYLEQKNYEKAEKYYRSLLEIEQKKNGDKTPEYLAFQRNLASVCISQNKNASVDSIYQRIAVTTKERKGENSYDYGVALKTLADFQKAKGKNKEAEANYLVAKQAIKNTEGTKHKDYLSILNSLASMYRVQKRIPEAEAYYNEMADIYRSNNGVRSQEYAACINNLAKLYVEENKFEQAEKLYDKTLKYCKSAVGEKNILCINTQADLAGLYRSTGQYNKSEATYNECKAMLLETVGEKNIDYANLLNNLALLYDEMGRYDLAEANFKKSLTITKDLVGEKHAFYATSLNNLASLYQEMGQYEQAEPMFKQAMAIRKEVLGENHPDYGASLNNLARFYEEVNRTKEALPLYQQAAQITKAAHGEQNHEYALALNNLANIYEQTGEFAKAEQNYNQSLNIIKNVLGETHPEYASTLHNLAFLYIEREKFKEAEVLLKKDLEIIKNSLGTNHPNYAKTLSSLANVYEHSLRYAEAEKSYLEALKIRKEKLGEHHPDYTYTLASLARVYTVTGKYNEAFNYWKQTIANYKEEIIRYFPSMSEKEKEEFYTTFADRFEQFNSLASMRYTSDPSVLSEMYNTQLATKAILFNASNKVRQRILGSNDPALIESFKKWQSDKEYLAQLYLIPKSELKINVDSLEQKTNELEKQLSLKSEVFKSANDAQVYTWQDVQKMLKPGEAAVEMIRFRKYKADKGGTYVKYQFVSKEDPNPKELKDSVYYAALIITPETKNNPEIVLMKNGTDLENRFIMYYRNTIKFNIPDEFCYANFWSKIAASLNGVKKVYFSPDGIYNSINLLSVYNPATKQYILDEIDIHTLTNTKDLLTLKPVASASKKIVLIGDPDFGQSGIATSRSGQLKRLPGSAEEVKKIATVVNNNNWAGNLYTGAQSTEELVKSTRDAKILHIATHGFFEPDAKQKENVDEETKNGLSVDNPLMKSGLYLSSASKTSGDDGMLTAYEAMNLSLDNTELVVLSACETGLGVVKNGEGVYGIQRAFRVAGARSIIISLWKVDDIATQKLMVIFYEEWLKSGSKRQAFTFAQNKLRSEFKEPLYWGAFIIVGE